MWLFVILIPLFTSAFSDTLVLNTDDTLICNHFREILKIEQRYFLCNEDTIFPDEIYSRINNEGKFRFVDDMFLKKTINGKLSFFTGIKDEIVWEDVRNGFDDPDFQYIKKRTPSLYYTFDDVKFIKYNSWGPNRLLVDRFKDNYEAYKYYRKSRTTQISAMLSANAFVIPLIIGLLKSDNRKGTIPYVILSGTGVLACTCITVSIPQKLFKRAVACYNTE